MRLLAVALLFVTALNAQRGMGGFGRHGGGISGFGGQSGFRSPGAIGYGRWGGGGFRGGSGFYITGRLNRGFTGAGFYNSGRFGYYRGGFGYRRPVFGYRRPIYGYGGLVYGGTWGWGGSYFPFYSYSAPVYTTPAVYPSSDPYAYNTSPTIIVVNLPGSIPDPSPSVAQPNDSSTYRSPVPAPAPDRAENRPLVTKSWAYIIAATDGSMWLAREYRVEDGTLYFSSNGYSWKKLPLDDVDFSLTEQLNRERGVAIDLR
ncbi:MAG TPA: DUF5320 domain-containing protein [Bryobacteraceae bacterium]|nr:DUF5320 domain-containing protein [Bryobacteraceae bacterium]